MTTMWGAPKCYVNVGYINPMKTGEFFSLRVLFKHSEIGVKKSILAI